MSEKRFWQTIATIWALTAVMLVIVSWSAIRAWQFPDPDDQMRLLEVRDWLSGQSWFDLTQHRLNEPDGVPMHWSRLVDLPIAFIIVVVQPLFGQAAAEQTALVLVPLLTLGVVMALLAALSRRVLPTPGQAVMSVCVVPMCIELLHQLHPMRIDHHGWQIALGLLTTIALVAEPTKKAGLVAGAAMAAWLSISLEGLPVIAAILALIALKWAFLPANRTLLLATTAATTIGALGIFAVSHRPDAWFASACDALSPVYLAVLVIATLGIFFVTALPIKSPLVRLAGLAGVGALSLVPLPLIAPACVAGPFGHLDPLVRHFWYVNVMEGLPVWVQSANVIVNTIALPIIGLVGAIMAVRTTRGVCRDRWLTLAVLLGAMTLAAIMVQRSASLANLLAIPGVIFALHPVLLRARNISFLPKRVLATLAIFMVASPGTTASLAIEAVAHDPMVSAVRKSLSCLDAGEMKALSVLPRGNVLAPLDISPTILVLTQHSAVASGHHRGADAMRDVIAAFTGSEDQAHAIIIKRRIDYVAFCPGLVEVMNYEYEAPAGFLAKIANGRDPPWLKRIDIKGTRAKVWRVR